MALQHKPIEAITAADLQALIDHEVREDRYIDYRAAPVGGGDGDKREFLADVSSVANASGGHILFGMDERQGLPIGLAGVPPALDLDAETLRLESMIRDAIAPRILGVRTRPVPLPGGSSALVLHIPQSWAQPHMVTYRGSNKFWGRGSAGKFLLDVGQVRAAFLASEGITTRIRNFRAERLFRIGADETPCRSGQGCASSCNSSP